MTNTNKDIEEIINDTLKNHCLTIYSNAHSEMTEEQFADHINELTPAYAQAILTLITEARIDELKWAESQLVAIPCEEDCTPERHAHHQGSWDMCRELERDFAERIQYLKESKYELS